MLVGMMPKAKSVKDQILTANRLGDGEVVYLAPEDFWTTHLAKAQVFSDLSGRERALIWAQGQIEENRILDPYFFDVEAGGGVRPITMREIIRANGPSVRQDLGKQASLQAEI